jgi:hypothetical protein
MLQERGRTEGGGAYINQHRYGEGAAGFKEDNRTCAVYRET